MKRLLITGVAGFIGSHVARRFLREGYEVVGVDDLSTGKIENVPEGVKFVRGDLAQTAVYRDLPAQCAQILHLAGQSSGEISFDDPVADLHMNTISTLRLIEFGIRSGAERIVYASSMSVYGAVPDAPIAETQHPVPLSCYGVGKLASEGYLRIYQRKLPFVAMRMFNVYGPGQDLSNLRQGMVSIYLAQALTGGKIEVKGSTARFRDFIFIDDVVEAWFRAATRAEALNKTLNIGTGRRTSVAQLLDAICAQVPGSSHFTSGSTQGDQSGIYADNRIMRDVLGIDRTVELAAGLPKFVAAARAQLLAT
jgi:UDP-glucose 4-epimerase